MSFYKKLTSIRDEKDVDAIAEEMRDRFGDFPKPVKNSLELLKLRLKASRASIKSISSDRQQVMMKYVIGVKMAADTGLKLKKKYPGCVFQPDKVIVHADTPRLLKLLGYILDDLPEALEESKLVYFSKLRS